MDTQNLILAGSADIDSRGISFDVQNLLGWVDYNLQKSRVPLMSRDWQKNPQPTIRPSPCILKLIKIIYVF